jgi:DNA-binding FadR family transcriptional regulator
MGWRVKRRLSSGGHAATPLHKHMKIIQALQTRNPRLAALVIEGHLSAVVQRTNIGEIERPQRSLDEILSFYADV